MQIYFMFSSAVRVSTHIYIHALQSHLCLCMCKSLTVSVPVIEPGPPSPPDSVTVEEVTDSTAQLAWSPGRDNGSPITYYLIQTRTPFTVGWQRVNTGRQMNFRLYTTYDVIQIIHGSPAGKFSYSSPRCSWEVRVLGQLQNVGYGDWRDSRSHSREPEVMVAAFT